MLSALAESARLDKSKLYDFRSWLGQDHNTLEQLSIQERVANIEAGQNMLGVRLMGICIVVEFWT